MTIITNAFMLDLAEMAKGRAHGNAVKRLPNGGPWVECQINNAGIAAYQIGAERDPAKIASRCDYFVNKSVDERVFADEPVEECSRFWTPKHLVIAAIGLTAFGAAAFQIIKTL